MITRNGNLMEHLDRMAIEAAYAAAPGNEIASGKFHSRESSAALAANAFGLFFDAPALLPPLPGIEDASWPAQSVTPEAIVRFPWSGGRHPCLDALIKTQTALIGVESKRYEPFRPKGRAHLSAAYWRPVWGGRMAGYEQIRDHLKDGSLQFAHLDAAQLIKHALGIRSAGHRGGKKAVLVYLYAEPDAWPDGRPILHDAVQRHRQEIEFFNLRVRDNEVPFVAISYGALLENWRTCQSQMVRDHAVAVRDHFAAQYSDGGHTSEPLWRSDDSRSHNSYE